MHFLNLINKVSQNKLHTLYIDTSNPSYFATIEHILERGGHLGIMGDRIAIKGTKEAKNTAISFLGKPCMFPQGAFLIAGLLKSKISLLWCEKLKNSYQVTLEPLCVNGEAFIKLGRNKEESIRGFMQKYVESLEKRVCKNPQFWFNFYDFWGQDVKQNL